MRQTPTRPTHQSPASNVERIGKDLIQSRITELFTGHDLSRLVAEVLKAEGFTTDMSPPGPDGGIDVFAGRGPLGLDSPRLIVQVKSSPSPVDVKVVRELNGVLSTQTRPRPTRRLGRCQQDRPP